MLPPVLSLSNAVASFQAVAFFSCLALLLSHLSYDDTLSILLLTLLVIFFGLLGFWSDARRHVVASGIVSAPAATHTAPRTSEAGSTGLTTAQSIRGSPVPNSSNQSSIPDWNASSANLPASSVTAASSRTVRPAEAASSIKTATIRPEKPLRPQVNGFAIKKRAESPKKPSAKSASVEETTTSTKLSTSPGTTSKASETVGTTTLDSTTGKSNGTTLNSTTANPTAATTDATSCSCSHSKKEEIKEKPHASSTMSLSKEAPPPIRPPKVPSPPQTSSKSSQTSPQKLNPPHAVSSPTPTPLLLSPKYYQVKAWLNDVSKVNDLIEDIPQAILEGAITVRKKIQAKHRDEVREEEKKAKTKGKAKQTSSDVSKPSSKGSKGVGVAAPGKPQLSKQATLEDVVDEAFLSRLSSSKSGSSKEEQAKKGSTKSSKSPVKASTSMPSSKTDSKPSSAAAPPPESSSPPTSKAGKGDASPTKSSTAQGNAKPPSQTASPPSPTPKQSKKGDKSPPKSPSASRAGSAADSPKSASPKPSVNPVSSPGPSPKKPSKPAARSPRKVSPAPSCSPSKTEDDNKANKIVDGLVGDAANQLALEFPGLAPEDIKIDLASLLAGQVQTFTSSKGSSVKPHQDMPPEKQAPEPQKEQAAKQPEEKTSPALKANKEIKQKDKDKKEDDQGKDDVSEKLLKGFLEWRLNNGLGIGEVMGAEGMKLDLDLPRDAATSPGPSQDQADTKDANEPPKNRPEPKVEENMHKAAQEAKSKMKAADARLLELAAKLNAA